MRFSPIVVYPLHRARGSGQSRARLNALAASAAAATRRVEREDARRFLNQEVRSSERDDRNREIQQFLDDRLAGVPKQRQAETSAPADR